MFYVHCPACQEKIAIPADAVGPDRTDPWNVIACDECCVLFDYDDAEVLRDDQPYD